MSQGEVIDYTAEVLSRRLLDYMNRGNWEEAKTLSALIEGYLDGLWSVSFQGGEPLFCLNDETINLNDFKDLDEPEQMTFDWYEDLIDREQGPYEGPLGEQ